MVIMMSTKSECSVMSNGGSLNASLFSLTEMMCENNSIARAFYLK